MTKLKIINAGQGAIHEYENTKRVHTTYVSKII
jgi:hypothetical protein